MLESDLQKLSVSGLITLYELDATKLGGRLTPVARTPIL